MNGLGTEVDNTSSTLSGSGRIILLALLRSLYRKLRSSRITRDPHELRAWIFLLMDANFKDNEFISKGECINLKRGEVLTSERWLSTTWGVHDIKCGNSLKHGKKRDR